jgi:hypothetical protein
VVATERAAYAAQLAQSEQNPAATLEGELALWARALTELLRTLNVLRQNQKNLETQLATSEPATPAAIPATPAHPMSAARRAARHQAASGHPLIIPATNTIITSTATPLTPDQDQPAA